MLRRFIFFFNETATTEIHTLSLHDALPIYSALCGRSPLWPNHLWLGTGSQDEHEKAADLPLCSFCASKRSEEHTSELQSRRDLVCRLLLEKKKQKTIRPSNSAGPKYISFLY